MLHQVDDQDIIHVIIYEYTSTRKNDELDGDNEKACRKYQNAVLKVFIIQYGMSGDKSNNCTIDG